MKWKEIAGELRRMSILARSARESCGLGVPDDVQFVLDEIAQRALDLSEEQSAEIDADDLAAATRN